MIKQLAQRIIKNNVNFKKLLLLVFKLKLKWVFYFNEEYNQKIKNFPLFEKMKKYYEKILVIFKFFI